MSDAGAPTNSLVFARDLACIHCSYNLHTIPLAAPCPECGRPSSDSIDSFAAALPRDLSRVRLGLLLMALAASVIPLLSLLVPIAVALAPYSPGKSALTESAGLAAASGVGFFGPILACVGVYFLTIPIRRGVSEPDLPPLPAARPRGALRAAALAYPILLGSFCLMYSLLIFYMFRASFGGGAAFGAILATAAVLATLAWTTRNALACSFIADASRRAGSARLSRLFTVMSWISRVAVALVVLLGLFILLAFIFNRSIEKIFEGPSNPWSDVLYAFGIAAYSITSLGFLAWVVLWPVMLFIAYARLARVAVMANGNFGRLLGPAPAPPTSTSTERSPADPSLAPPTRPVYLQNPHTPSPPIGTDR